MTIYKITCKENGMMYIGKTNNFDVRKQSHLAYLRNDHHQEPELQKDFNKYGENAFTFEIIKGGLHQQTATKLEEMLINTIKEIGKAYNNRIGNKVDFNDPRGIEFIEKLKNHNKSEEFRKKTSERMKKLAKDPAWRKRNSESKKGRVFSEEHKRKLSEAHKTKEYKKKMTGSNHPAAQKVYCNENGKTYGSMKEAAADLGIYASSITAKLSGRFKTSRTYTFKKV